MLYAVILDCGIGLQIDLKEDQLIFDDVNNATQVLKKYKNSRMKACSTYEEAIECIRSAPKYALKKDNEFDLSASFESLSINNKSSDVNSSHNESKTPTKIATQAADEAEPTYPSAKPPLLNDLRRKIEQGNYEAVEDIIWSNPRSLITCSDSAIYLMAGPKYNAAHISARANKPDILALILDTVTNLKFIRKLYPNETDDNLQERANHLIDSYLNTPDPRQGNTPLHFACKYGYYKVVKVLLTFEGCDLTLRDSNGLTAEGSACTQFKKSACGSDCDGDQDGDGGAAKAKEKILGLFRRQLNMPAFRDQLRKRLTMERRRSRANSSMDSSIDTTFSDIDDSFISQVLNKI